MELLDYVFYRIYSYYKVKKDANPLLMGCLVLSVTVLMTLQSIFSIFSLFSRDLISFVSSRSLIILVLFLNFVFLLIRFNKEGLTQKLHEKYAVEEIETKKRKGRSIITYIIVVLFIPIIIGVLRHNLGVNI